MKKLLLLFLFISCAKTSYLVEQGIGQLKLEWNGVDNEKLLSDPKISDEHKRKIRLITKAKNYFYNYFGYIKHDIYDETTYLKGEAVTYLVIASPESKIEARKFSFPLFGDFPYLGFFSKKSALNRAEKLKEEENMQTYIRPVYAYSTLNQWIFEDNILSSFFHYNDRNLVSLVFHELVHTIFFMKNNVTFNENLAEFISKKLTTIYFNDSTEENKLRALKERRYNLLNLKISALAKELDEKYKKKSDSQSFKEVLSLFLKERFKPTIKKECEKQSIEKCYPLNGDWNNARFAAFLTYEEKQDKIAEIFESKTISLKAFLQGLNDMREQFEDQNKIKTFLGFLEEKL